MCVSFIYNTVRGWMRGLWDLRNAVAEVLRLLHIAKVRTLPS
jgi:hypothetical protein